MKRWYSFYNEQLIKSQRPVDIFTNEEQTHALEKGQRPVGVATHQLEEVVERTVKEIEMRKN
jgi:hypothetical protein